MNQFLNPARVGRPRLDPYKRLLGRFYEALFLLKVLGQTRGDHTSVGPAYDREKEHRRKFLQNLCYICDFEKGGHSTTAIGLEETNVSYNFWVAANAATNARGVKIVDFLRQALFFLRDTRNNSTTDTERFVRDCAVFAAGRIKKEASFLFRAIGQCNVILDQKDTEAARRLRTWLSTVEGHAVGYELCLFAYNNRHSKLLNIVMIYAQEREAKEGPRGKQDSFADVRHYLGRLANHIRAPRELVADRIHVSYVLGAYEVYPVSPVISVQKPERDSHTTLHGILNRMFKPEDLEKSEVEKMLLYRNTQSGLFETFLAQYEHCTPQVHAEVQVLELFYARKLTFAGKDRYIACSKPACLCCQLYFKHHPARMVVPDSHRKIWIKWGPPLVVNFAKNDGPSNRQRDILNKITGELRAQIIAELLGQSVAGAWHPDSCTAITEQWYPFVDDRPGRLPGLATVEERRVGGEMAEGSTPDDSDIENGGVPILA